MMVSCSYSDRFILCSFLLCSGGLSVIFVALASCEAHSVYGPTRWGAFPGPRGSSVLPCCDYSIALLTVLFNAQNSQNSTVNIVDIDTVNRVDIVV